MHGAHRHLDYHRARHVDLVGAAERRDVARELAVARDGERRTFLARAWQRRFGRPVAPAPPVTA